MRNRILNAYTSKLELQDIPDDILCTVFADKRQVGGEPDTGVIMPVSVMLTERFPQDHHFTSYQTPQSMRLRKEMQEPKKFDICAYDLDFDNHQSKPSAEDFEEFVRCVYVMHYGGVPLPNVIYQTRGGCRLVYFIRPLADADLFEAHVKALAKKIAEPLNNSRRAGGHRYDFDNGTLDWTRLYRCPAVVREDDKGIPREEYNYHVRLFHADLLDILRFKAAKKREYVVKENDSPLDDVDLRRLIQSYDNRMAPGCRNTELHKLHYMVWKKWPDDAEDKIYPYVFELGLKHGLTEREIRTSWESAKRAAERE
jgi:hypothetical protein